VSFTVLVGSLTAQTVVSTPGRASSSSSSSETLQLQALTKKIEEQNAKIDILSQQILKLEQQLAHPRPGVIIGEPDSTTAAQPAATPIARTSAGITSHTVARGETLTSIAKLYGVNINELQRFNHIDDPLKLRAGQTMMIPPATTPASSPGQ
jgi:LysM repeat protein